MSDILQKFIDGCQHDVAVYERISGLYRFKAALLKRLRCLSDKMKSVLEDGSESARAEFESYLEKQIIDGEDALDQLPDELGAGKILSVEDRVR